MAYLPSNLPALLRARGLTVHERGGWGRLGAATLRPAVVVVHDDIIGGCPRAVPGIIPNGRPGKPFLPGPLYNIWISCSGDVHLVAAGVANNAGKGSWQGITGNSRTVGVCRSHHPDGGPATAAQNASTAVVASVLTGLYSIPIANVIGHKEWTSRKPDPWHLAMADFRTLVALGGGDDMTPEELATLGEWMQEQRALTVAEVRKELDQVDRYSVWSMRQAKVPDAEIKRVLGKTKLPGA